MENTNQVEKQLRQFESIIDSEISKEDLIEFHKKLVGVTTKDVSDCGVYFIERILGRDWAQESVYHYTTGVKDFIKSNYLSDYYKNAIKLLLSNKDVSNETLSVLNSDKPINEMSEDEIKSIYLSLTQHSNAYLNFLKKFGSVYSFLDLLIKLDGEGVISFIKNNFPADKLARSLFLTSGVSVTYAYHEKEYYSDLNESNLIAIFNKLLIIDQKYALNFVKMVKKMPTLGSEEFFNSFKWLAKNHFNVDSLEVSPITFEWLLTDAGRNVVDFVSNFSMENINDECKLSAAEQMKKTFIGEVESILFNNSGYGEDSQSVGSKKMHK